MIDLGEVLANQHVAKAYDVCLEADEFSYKNGVYPITQKQPVRLTITGTAKNKVSISGRMCVHLSIPCDRCLRDVDCEVSSEFERNLIIDEEPEDDETEILDSTQLDVEKFLFSEILLNLPIKVLCKADCLGICPVCGKNLNDGECGCDRRVIDPRMAAVLDVFNEFNQND